ncbi:MAG: hypothetical protein IPM29_27605 [Planctomycetes bacterium]|nr:hypothetical protein [Planctomycetota bacterium]
MARSPHRTVQRDAIALTILLLTCPALAQRALDPVRINGSWVPPVTLERNPAGALTARGQDYAARFGAGVVAFASAGVDGGRSAALDIELGEIRRADGTRVAGVPAGVEPAEDGACAVFERTEGVRECFEVRPDGLEWTLVFEQRPAGSGDLIVEASLHTELQTELATDGTLQLRGEDGGGVSIGAVTGVDAQGASVAGLLRLDGRTLRLELPGSFVDAASYPLTLDPLVGSIVTSINPGYAPAEIDCAYAPSGNNYLVGWTRSGNPFLGQNPEVWIMKLDWTGQSAGSPIRLAQFGPNASPVVQVVYVAAYSRFLVVYGGDTGLYCQSVDPRSPLRSGQVTLSLSPILQLAAGGDPQSDRARVAWIPKNPTTGQAMGVYSTAVTVGLSAPVPWQTSILASGALDYLDVDVGYDRDRALIAWSQFNFLQSAVVVIEVDARGAPVSNPLYLDSFTSVNRIFYEVSVESSTSGGLVLWAKRDDGTGDYNLYGRLVFADPGRPPVTASPVLAIATDPTYSERYPSVGWLGSKYGVFFLVATSSTARIEGRELDPRCMPCGLPITITPVGPFGIAVSGACIASQRSSGASSNDALLLFTQTGLVGQDQGILATRFSAFGAGGSIVTAGGQCGSARTVGTIGTDGPFAIGNRDFRVTLSGSTGNIALALVGVPGLDIPCGACVITQPVLISGSPIVLGSASYVFEVPCLLTMIGARVTFQWLVNEPSLTASCIAGWGATPQLHARLDY